MYNVTKSSDALEQILDSIFSPQTDKFPAIDIYTIGDKQFIDVAVTGFDESDLSIQTDGNKLILTAKKIEVESVEKNYFTRKIARRNFVKEFKILKPISSIEVSLKNGILTIEVKSEVKDIKNISIKTF